MNTGRQLRDVFPSDAHENRILWREYLPLILQNNEFQSDTQDREDLVRKVARCLHRDGRYYQAEALFKELYDKKKKTLKNDDGEMLDSMAWMASTYQNQGRWTEAEKLEVQVMETRKTILGPEHPDTLTSMPGMPGIYLPESGTMDEGGKLK